MSNLNRLIAAMSPAEKRYTSKAFRLHSREGKSKVKRLYDQLLKDTEQSDAQLKSNLGYSSKSQFSTDKNYLYKFCLKALCDFDRAKPKEYNLLHELQEARILFDKGLNKAAKKKLEAAIKVAQKYEFFDIEAMLLRELLASFYKVFKPESWVEERKRIFDFHNELIAKQEQTYDQINWLMRINEIKFVKGTNRSEDQKKQIEQMLEEHQVDDINLLLTDRIKTRYGTFRRSCFELLGDADRELQESANNVEVALNSAWKETYIRLYILHMFLYCDTFCESYARLTNKDDTLYKRCRNEIMEWEQSPGPKPENAVYYLFQLGAADIQLALTLNERPRIEATLSECERIINKYGGLQFDESRSRLWVMIGAANITLGNYESALDFFSLVKQAGEKVVRTDFFHLSMVLEMIAHYELGNTYYLKHQLENYLRHFSKRRNAYRTEKTCLRYLRKLAKSPKVDGYNDPIYKKFADELIRLESNAVEAQSFKAYNIRTKWLEPTHLASEPAMAK